MGIVNEIETSYLTSEEFYAIAAKTRLKERVREFARAVLVEGRAQAYVAAEAGMSSQCVNSAVGVIQDAYFKLAKPGTQWVSIEHELPEVLALEIVELEKNLKSCDSQPYTSTAIARAVDAIPKINSYLNKQCRDT